MRKFLKIILLTGIFINTTCLAYDTLPPMNKNSSNPYIDKLGKIEVKLLPFEDESPYDMEISRMEREWFKKEFKHYPIETRLSKLEEKIFGTIRGGTIKERFSELVKAFDVQKRIQARELMYGQNIFSGLPTSLPMNVNDLLEN